MRKGKSLVFLIMTLALSMVLSSCGHLQPKKKKSTANADAEAVVANYFKKLKGGDLNKAATYTEESFLDQVPKGDPYDDIISEFLPTITYVIKECKADEDKASGSLKLELTCADLVEISDGFEGEYTLGEFLSEISAKKAPTRTESFKIELVYDGKWKMSSDEEMVEYLFGNWEDYEEIFAETTTESTTEDPGESTSPTTVHVWDEASKDIAREGWYSYDTEIYEIRPPASQYYEGVTTTLEYSLKFRQPYELSGKYEFYDADENLIYSNQIESYSKEGFGFLDCTYALPSGETFTAGQYHLKIYINDRLIRDEYTEVLVNNWEEVEDSIVEEGFYDYGTEKYVEFYTFDATDTIEYSIHFEAEAHVLAYFVLMDEGENMIAMGVSATYYSPEDSYLDCTYSDDSEMIPVGHYKMLIYLYNGDDDPMIREVEIDVVEPQDD